MSKFKKNILTGIVILISIGGIVVFGYRAILDNMEKDRENPYELNLDQYKQESRSDQSWHEIQSIPLDLNKLSALCLNDQEDLYIAAENHIIRLDSTGKEKSRISISGTVTCLATDLLNRLHVGMKDHVDIYKDDEKISEWESLGENAYITSIAVSENRIYLADAGNRIVWKFNQHGRLLGRIGDPDPSREIEGFIIPSPYFDVAIDAENFLWVANTGRHRLEQYDDAGNLLRFWGEYSMQMSGFCGCCNPSHFVILQDGSFVTSEKGIPRIKVYSTAGELTAVVASPDQFLQGTVGLDLTVDKQGRVYLLDPKQKMIRIFSWK